MVLACDRPDQARSFYRRQLSTALDCATIPEYFGDLGSSLFTLFQVMTGEAWSEVARAVMEEHPSS